jgi:peptidoglycan/LPS O-acetylase OafA/YrhL
VLFFIVFTRLSSVYFYCWLIGAFAYLVRPKQTSTGGLLAAAVISLCGIVANQIGSDTISLHTGYWRNFVPPADISRILLSAGIALLFQHLVTIAPKRSFAALVDRAGTKLACFSYSLYLTHYPILALMQHLGIGRAPGINIGSIFTYFTVVLTCMLFGLIMYWLFERRTHQVRAAVSALINQRKVIIPGLG